MHEGIRSNIDQLKEAIFTIYWLGSSMHEGIQSFDISIERSGIYHNILDGVRVDTYQ